MSTLYSPCPSGSGVPSILIAKYLDKGVRFALIIQSLLRVEHLFTSHGGLLTDRSTLK